MYDLLVFIGRFQPLHLGHQKVIDHALSISKEVLVLIGSSNQARSTRNPLTYEERSNLITAIYPDVITRPLHDHTYNDTAWIVEVQKHVYDLLLDGAKWQPNGIKDFKIGLVGYEKDHSSYYLKMFPDWANEDVKSNLIMDATVLRNQMYEDKVPARWFQSVALNLKVYDWLHEFMQTEEFAKLKEEYNYLVEYKKTYGEGPFLTADALVQVGGKILLINRGKEYGHGLLAMPGGFLNKNERFQSAMVRELKEETNLRVPIPVINGSIISHRVFDDPHRSERGRLITEAFHVKLVNDTKLPEVRGGDDADKADWYDIGTLSRADFFEDHFHIIKAMLGVN